MIVAMIAASIWYFLYPSLLLLLPMQERPDKKTKNLYCFKIMVIPFFAKPLCQLLTSAWKEVDNHGQFRLCLHLAYHTDAWPLPCLLAPRKRFFSLQSIFNIFYQSSLVRMFWLHVRIHPRIESISGGAANLSPPHKFLTMETSDKPKVS